MIFDQGHRAPYSFEDFLLEKSRTKLRETEQNKKMIIIIVPLHK
jgi:hypothetical protein